MHSTRGCLIAHAPYRVLPRHKFLRDLGVGGVTAPPRSRLALAPACHDECWVPKWFLESALD